MTNSEFLFSSESGKLTEQLLKDGANPNVTLRFSGNTPLMYAHCLGKVVALLNAGADPNVENEDGLKAVDTYTDVRTRKILFTAMEHYDRTPLMKAWTVKDMVELLKDGADPNEKNKEGETALMYARNVDQTSILLKAGADPNIENDDGLTALEYVHSENQTNLLKKAMLK